MVDGVLDPDDPYVVEYEPESDGVTVDVEGQDEIDVELFGAAGEDASGEQARSGANGGYVIAHGYDVSDVDSIDLFVADGRSGQLDGGSGGSAEQDAGDGGGLTAVVRSGAVDIAAHGGGGGANNTDGGGGGAAGGDGGRKGSGLDPGEGGESGQTAPGVSDLGGDGGSAVGPDIGSPGSGEVIADERVESSDVTTGDGRSVFAGLARIEFSPAALVEITETNSPVTIGDEVEVDVDVSNFGPNQETITVELEVDPA